MSENATILDFSGTYGGPASRDRLLRALKEALALVEQAPAGTEFICPGIRIDWGRVSEESGPPATAIDESGG